MSAFETNLLEEELAPEQEIMKPKVLYHASTNRGIQEFEPRASSIRDPREGPVVFGTPNKAVASMFIVPTDDMWTKKSGFGDTLVMVIADRKRFEELDKGGSIYTFSSDTFTSDSNKGMGKNEWTSKVQVKPVTKEDYDSGLQAMLDLGVQVYFVDETKFREIKDSPDHGFEIICGLKSENEEKGINVRKLPKE